MITLQSCPKCGRLLIKSDMKGYAFQCLECDEDFYSFEVTNIKTNNNMESFRPDEVKLIFPTTIKSTEKPRLETSLEVFEFALQFYDADIIEHHISTKIILLDGGCKVLGVTTISESAQTYDIVETKFILQAAILANAQGIIVVMNCPDGVTEPCEDMQELKNQIKLASYLFNIELTDYMMISKEDYYSFSDNKVL